MSKLVKGEHILVDNLFTLYRTVPIPMDAEQFTEEDNNCENEDVLNQVKNQADTIIKQAVEFKENIIKQVEEESLTLYENAKKSGYIKGYADGLKIADEKGKALIDEMQLMIKQLDDSREALVEESRKHTLMLACDIARKVIDKQLECEDESFVNIYKNAVRDLYDKKYIRLKISKYEKNFVTSSADFLMSLIKGATHLEIEVLDDADRGTCIVETDDEIIETSAQKQIDIIEQAVLEE